MPAGFDALGHADAARGGHQRRRAVRIERVEIGPVLPADLEQVFRALRGHEHHA